MMRNIKTIHLLLFCLIVLFGCKKEGVEKINIPLGDLNYVDYFHEYSTPVTIPSPENGYYFKIDIDGNGNSDVEYIHEYSYGNFSSSHSTHIRSLNPKLSFLLDSNNIKVGNKNEIKYCQEFIGHSSTLYKRNLLSAWSSISTPYQVNDSTWAVAHSSNYNGEWHLYDDNYISFKLNSSNRWLIGWIRQGFNDQGKLEIYGYGYTEISGCD